MVQLGAVQPDDRVGGVLQVARLAQVGQRRALVGLGVLWAAGQG
jgi:hypothetical protein